MAIKTNYVKAKIDNVQQNSKCRLCGERDETINLIVSECNKLVQKEYLTRHKRAGRGIYWELCKRLNFDNNTEWYLCKSKSLLENETHKILWDFENQTDHLIPADKQKKKRTYGLVDFAIPA